MSKSLKESLWVVAALVAVILIPVALRSRQMLHAHADETLVIISPHNEAVRFEFTRAFTEAHFRKTGRTVSIDWRTPGGTSEIARYLAAEFLGAFQYHWEHTLQQPWSAEVQTAFDNPKVKPGNDTPAARARAAFLDSNVGCGIDLFFGGGSYDYGQQAVAGRLVPVDLLKNEARFPQTLGGEILWDPQGRWAGCALSAFGICYNTDALRRIGFAGTPEQWPDLARPELKGAVALADPTQSGSVAKAFELIVQQQIAEAGGNTVEGWRRAFILIRRIAGNSRYFSDSATRIVWDVESGDAAAGMSIDFYGRMQSDSARRPDGTSRMGYVTPRGGSSFGADPIGLLRGSPSPELAREFIAFVLSPEGQKLWNWKVGVPGGPVRYALRRLPVLPELYDAKDDSFRSDPGVNPYTWAETNPPYHPEWTASLFRTIAFLIQATAIDPHEELREAWDALIAHGFPPQATAAFEDITGMDYQTANQVLKPALASGQKIEQARLSRELCDRARAQYLRAAELAREGK